MTTRPCPFVGKRPFMARFEWWPDVRFWGGFPLALVLAPAGVYGIWYEAIIIGEWICFHSIWGSFALGSAIVMVFFRTTRLRRFEKLMGDPSASHFLENKSELEGLVPHLPRAHRRRFRERLERTAHRRRPA